jgi:MFS transporter, FSR family, fosmidomycin resistance protein
LAVALAIELADELADGAKGAALPLIRHGLGLSYAQVAGPLLLTLALAGGGSWRACYLVLAVLSAATAPWYPLLQARLYGSLRGRSSVAVTLSSAAGLVGGLGPLAVGIIAERAGLPWALGVLAIVPVVILVFGNSRAGHALT